MPAHKNLWRPKNRLKFYNGGQKNRLKFYNGGQKHAFAFFKVESCQNFFGGPPSQFGSALARRGQSLACCALEFLPAVFQFLTTFNFDREYLRNGSTYQKSEKLLIIYNPSHVRRKKLRVLCIYTLMKFFRETISRLLGGAAPWNFYTR